MTAVRAASHIVLWKNPRAPVTLGANPLLGWQRYEWSGGELRFKKWGPLGPLASLALPALEGAIAATRNVTIAQQVENPETASPADLLTKWPHLRPMTMICPERPARPGVSGTPRWIMAWLTGNDPRKAQPQTLPETAIQAAVDAFAKESFPAFNAAPSFYAPPSLLLRHDTNAEILGLVEPQKVTPDMILARVADDPEVLEAGKRWDRATPETYPPLIRARSDAQSRLGIAEAEQVLLHSGEVEDILMPIVMKLATDAERATELRQKFRRLYGAYAERVLAFCLRTYQHGNIDGLKRAAGVA